MTEASNTFSNNQIFYPFYRLTFNYTYVKKYTIEMFINVKKM